MPLYLGVRAVIAKSFARIHAANLINAGILPLTFANPDDYDTLTQGETLTLTGIVRRAGQRHHDASRRDDRRRFAVCVQLYQASGSHAPKAGGLLNYTKEQGND